jgi:hypothetical protein
MHKYRRPYSFGLLEIENNQLNSGRVLSIEAATDISKFTIFKNGDEVGS